jgi:hypothetical protein
VKPSPLAVLKQLEGLPGAVVPLDRERARSLGCSTEPSSAFECAVEALFAELDKPNPNGEVVVALLEVLEHVTGSPGELVGSSPARKDDPGIYFASGSNRASMIRGVAAAGRALGVAANEVSPSSEQALYELAGTGIPVFVDSGAFGEVLLNEPHKHRKGSKACREKTCPGAGNVPFPNEPEYTFVEVKPITHQAWLKVLALYSRLAQSLGPQVYLVAPDRVGSQTLTMQRLKRYAPQVRELRKTGANIIVGLQRANEDVPGLKLSAYKFDLKVREVLGFDDYIRGIPSRRGATPPAEVGVFVAELRKRIPVPRIHLLGKGLPYLARPSELREKAAYREALQGCSVTCDSVRFSAICSKGRGLHDIKAELREKTGMTRLKGDPLVESYRRAFENDPGGGPVLEFVRLSPRIKVVQCKVQRNAGPQIILLPPGTEEP